jgi:phospholipid/cholesterol/gamma-HCH transport system permease protein
MTAATSTLTRANGNFVEKIAAAVGELAIGVASRMGKFTFFGLETLRGLPEVKIWFPRFLVEAWNIGVGSFLLVLLIAGFAGAVTALQTGYQFSGSIPLYVVGTLVVSSIILELGPVLTALVLAGRIGARYAAELGTMRVTEQIDALESLGRAPSSHLIVPRVLAALIMIPALTIFANTSGILVGWWAVKLVLPVTNMDFIYGAQLYFRPWDAWYSLIKSFFFGGTIGLISCFMGMNTQQGAEGVGKGTTGAVVTSTIIVLLLDTVLTKLLLNT